MDNNSISAEETSILGHDKKSDDIRLAHAYISIYNDPIKGTDQTGDNF
jgi:hypothetical protein